VLKPLRVFLNRQPLMLPLLAVIGALLSLHFTWAWGLSILALGIALLARRWAILVMLILCALLAHLRLSNQEGHCDDMRAGFEEACEVQLVGTIVRTSKKGRIVEIKGAEPACIEWRGDVQGNLGDIYELSGWAEPLNDSCLPGQFDRQAWLERMGVVARMEHAIARYQGSPFSWSSLRAYSAAMREKLAERLIPPGTEKDKRRQILCALLLGEKSYAQRELLDVFLWSGTMHAFAVSGLHVGIVAGLLWFVLLRCRFSSSLAIVSLLSICAFYVFITGMSVSSLRAFIMLACFFLGILLNRQVFLANICCAAALFILLIDPSQLFQPGFLLSFIIYSVICMTIRLSNREAPLFAPDSYLPKRYWTRFEYRWTSVEKALRSAALVSMAAWLCSIPICLFYFNALSTYGFLSNFVITPLLPIVMALALLSMVFSWIPLLGGILTFLALQATGILLAICSFFASLPAAYVSINPAAAADAFVLLEFNYGQSACLLGGEGMLLGTISVNNVQWTLRPVLFHEGFRVTSYIPELRSSVQGSAESLRHAWPSMQTLPCAELGEIPRVFNLESGSSWTIYPAITKMRRPTMDDRLPMILWECKGRRLLYLGNASAATLYAWAARSVDLHADVLVLGFNQHQPFVDEIWMRKHGIRDVILLPSAKAAGVHLPSPLRTHSADANGYYRGKLLDFSPP